MRRLRCALPALLLALVLALSACGEKAPAGADLAEYVPGGGWGGMGDVLRTYWFGFSVERAWVCGSFGGYTAGDGQRLVVVEVSLTSAYDGDLPMGRYDFQIQWGGGEEDFGYPLSIMSLGGENLLPDEYTLTAGGTLTGLLVYEVPVTDTPDYSLSFQESFTDGRAGDTYFIYFTASEDAA